MAHRANGRASAARCHAELRMRADVAGNGELLWPDDAALDAGATAGDRDNRRYFLAATREDAYSPTLRQP